MPFQFLWNIQNFVLSWKQSVWRKKSMFWELFNFRQNRGIRTLPEWPFFGWFWEFFGMMKISCQLWWNIQNFVLLWYSQFQEKKACFWNFSISGPYRGGHFLLILSIFWNVENTLPTLLKHSKFCSFMKIISLKKKSHVLGTFHFGPKSLYPDLTVVAIFWLVLSIFWNVENTLPILETFKTSFFHEDNQFQEKKACFGNFSIFGKIAVSGPYRRGHFLVDFEYFLKWWKYPANSCETFKILFFYEYSHFQEKKACFGNFSISGPYRRGHFLVDFEYFLKCWKYHSNSSETFKILFFHEDNQFEEKKACFGDFLIWTKISESGPYRRGHFLVDFEYFLKCWKYPSNCCETFKILFLHEDNPIFGNFTIFGKIAVSGPYRCGHFLVDFEYFLKWWKYPANCCETFKILFFYEYSQFQEKKACFGNFSISGPYRRGHFLVDFEYFLKCWKYSSNSSETFKILFFHEDNQFEEKKAYFGDFSIWSKIAVSGPYWCGHFLLILSIFWNVENTLPALLKHSKFCSFMKIISLKKKSHVLGTFHFGPKSHVLGTFQF